MRGDQNQLMQVFFNIVNNGLDAKAEQGGAVLTIKTVPPHRDFDPFYTTKSVAEAW